MIDPVFENHVHKSTSNLGNQPLKMRSRVPQPFDIGPEFLGNLFCNSNLDQIHNH